MITNKTGGLILQTMLYLVNQQPNEREVDSNTLYHLNIGEDTDAARCYGVYGCFHISSPWTSESRPVSLFPESPEKMNPQFPMFTRENTEKPTFLDLNDPNMAHKLKINSSLPIYFIVHGYMESGDKPWIQNLTLELLTLQPCAVILVDWKGGSGPPYTQAVANIRLVAAIAAHLIDAIVKITGHTNLDHIHVIGHSLGAHLSGYIGYTLIRDFGLTLGRITGLDPAEPHFSKTVPIVRLDQSAAKYVDVIHTDCAGFIKGGLGLLESIGHVDYYPNGGIDQPGCGESVMANIAAERGSFLKGIRRFLGCNHIRSYEFFTESIKTSCPFLTVSCPSFEQFKKGDCFSCETNGHLCLRFGYHGINSYKKLRENGFITNNSSISTYLLTGKSHPFCRSHYRIEVKLSNSSESQLHGGEIGILWVVVSGINGISERIALNNDAQYYEPGMTYLAVLGGQDVGNLLSAVLEWEYKTSMFNPLTWRILASPRIFISYVKIDLLEHQSSLSFCPQVDFELIANHPQEIENDCRL